MKLNHSVKSSRAFKLAENLEDCDKEFESINPHYYHQPGSCTGSLSETLPSKLMPDVGSTMDDLLFQVSNI